MIRLFYIRGKKEKNKMTKWIWVMNCSCCFSWLMNRKNIMIQFDCFFFLFCFVYLSLFSGIKTNILQIASEQSLDLWCFVSIEYDSISELFMPILICRVMRSCSKWFDIYNHRMASDHVIDRLNLSVKHS